MEVDRDDRRDAADTRVAAGKYAAVAAAVSDGHHPLGIWRGAIGSLQWFPHVAGHRPRDEEHVRMPGRGDKAEPEAFQVVVDVAEGMDLQLAAIAGAGIYLANG